MGTGKLDLFGFVHGDSSAGQAGAAAAFEHRWTSSMAAFAEGRVGKSWGYNPGFFYDAKLGMRLNW